MADDPGLDDERVALAVSLGESTAALARALRQLVESRREVQVFARQSLVTTVLAAWALNAAFGAELAVCVLSGWLMVMVIIDVLTRAEG